MLWFYFQCHEINNLAEKFSVKIDFKKTLGIVRLQGLQEDVSDASDAVQKILRKAQQDKLEAQKAFMLATIVQWIFIEVNSSGIEKYHEYDRVLHPVSQIVAT